MFLNNMYACVLTCISPFSLYLPVALHDLIILLSEFAMCISVLKFVTSELGIDTDTDCAGCRRMGGNYYLTSRTHSFLIVVAILSATHVKS